MRLQIQPLRWSHEAANWQRIVAQVLRATGEEAGQAAQRACGDAVVRVGEALDRHARQMQRVLWSSSAAVLLGMLAAAGLALFR